MQAKTKTKKAPLLEGAPPAPMIGPPTRGEWIAHTIKNVQRSNATAADREEYRRLLDEEPYLADVGSLERMYFTSAHKPFEGHALTDENMKRRRKLMRDQLAGPAPSPLETLLVEVVLGAHADYWHFALAYKQKTAESFTLNEMEQWERILSSKEQRYLRAIAELARVRRLLNLPAPQVNINLPGGQQVNINEATLSKHDVTKPADLAGPAPAPRDEA